MDASPPNWTTFMFVCLTTIMHQNWALEVTCMGRLSLDPGPVVEWGSSLSILCQIEKCHASQNPFSIMLNYQPLHIDSQNCSAAWVHIAKMTMSSPLLCLVDNEVVCGLDLKAGYQPAKVTQFHCFTLNHSEAVNCSWMNGRESHLPTNYSLTFTSVSGNKSFACKCLGCNSTSIPRSSFSESSVYDVLVIAQNALGVSNSDLFTVRDLVIPNPPTVRGLNFTHMDGSRFLLTWSSLEPPEPVQLRIRLGGGQIWEGDASQIIGSRDGVVVAGLKAMTEYQIEWKVCGKEGQRCSLWSAPIRVLTPGIAPTQIPEAWRTISHTETCVNVTVSWKAASYPPYNCSRNLMNLQPVESETFTTLRYEVSYWLHDRRHVVSCPSSDSQVQLQLAAEVKWLNLTLVTSAGRSPPATLSLTYTNIAAPVLTRGCCSSEDWVLLAWRWRADAEVSGAPVGYIIQWQYKGSTAQWKRLSQDCNSTYIDGLKPGSRYDVLLHSETTRGLSQPAFYQVYSKEIRPRSGPNALIQSVDSKSVLVQWEELMVEHQGGFISHYTIYIRKHGTGTFKPMSQVNASSPREKLLDSTEGGFDLRVSAWNAAGEGPKGAPVSWHWQKSDKVFVGMWAVAAVSLVLGINLICLKCVRTRIRAACLTVGPAWLFEKFPKVGNSNAIKLLKDERCVSDSLWISVCSDSYPPISPVEDVAEPIPQSFLFPSVQKTEAPELRTTRQEIVDPYKPQWTDLCQTSGTVLPESPEVQPDKDAMEEHPLWACLSPPSSGEDIGLLDVTVGGLGVTGNFLFPPSFVLDNTEWHTDVSGGTREGGGFSLALLTERPTVLPNDLLSTQQLSINSYSPQECWLKVAHNT